MGLIFSLSIFIFGLLLLLFNTVCFGLLKPKSKKTKILSYYLLASFIEGTICFSLYFVFQLNNFFLSHIFFNLQMLFLSYFFYNIFESKKVQQFIKFSVLVLILVFAVQYILNPAAFFKFNLYEIVSVCVLLIMLALLNIYYTLGQSKRFFYFSIGVIVYFTCTCLVYLLGGYTIILCKNPLIDHWIIKDVFFIIFQVLVFKEYNYLKLNRSAN